ncbi:efflux RND transporter periplasmic adaptor subunit [Enterobacter sp. DTU_2021_1002640_1_SI_PRY_ASU_LCPMC_013]|uniref:efflux RND transporter periplasmic adaptor subunit n=1 Tax=Enterobacter sp. DTU_2021_1002640_1_SI_PRY_ASU_LCPMC_013 TaxID=3077940 RepID=UPI0028EA8406|nr:efflux RND transporter periplasmic adaptor subunit [Enterobacter sp. DTU_2021_1002640_1_SI_PRY_ASU_LCPMC_013]WNU99167.1 efflux RND transporter periplasmic adaptor subunit [Enterobacter sp. DTU_2021_1002640_1_SI_PRY_ASU_LCPMC_013]
MAVTICALFIPLFMSGCDDTPSVSSDALRPVKTWTVPTAQQAPSSAWTGTVEPAEEVTLHFRIDGRLASRPVDIGSPVTKNQTVATLTGSQSQEEVAAALAEYQDAFAAEKKGRQDLERTKKLYEIGTASRAQLEEAIASVTALNARKVRAQAQKSGALNESGFSTLKAPFDGIVTLFTPYPGQTVTAGQDVVRIASRNAEVQFSVPATVAAKLHEGDSISVIAGERKTNARIRYISPQLDNSTRTSLVRASLSLPENAILYGSAVSVELNENTGKVIPLPASSLMRAGNQPAVFVVDPKTHKLESRDVTIQRYSVDKAYVSAGLQAGEQVVAAGVSTLTDGEKVAISAGAVK